MLRNYLEDFQPASGYEELQVCLGINLTMSGPRSHGEMREKLGKCDLRGGEESKGNR
jgi:hypothetical protein